MYDIYVVMDQSIIYDISTHNITPVESIILFRMREP